MDRSLLDQLEEEAREAYRQDGRFYHDERHLRSCLSQLEQQTGLSNTDVRQLRWAFLWHDAVYDPRRADNEERSAELAVGSLRRAGADPSDVAAVERLILLTKGHEVRQHDHLGAIMTSIDLSVLGSEPNTYREYVFNVRREYAHVPEEQWKLGRSAVLRNFLAAEQIFAEPTYRKEYEARARLNLSAELKSLDAS